MNLRIGRPPSGFAAGEKNPAEVAPPPDPQQRLHRVDLIVDGFGADFLRIHGHHRIDRLLHGGMIGEGDALQLPGFFHRV
jgi:hypothetical protein